MPAPSYPADVTAITPTWLSQALGIRFPGVRLASARLVQRIDGTATKLRYELGYAGPEDVAGAPRSLWVKGGFDPKGASQGEAFANEVNFFCDIAPLLPINKPATYYGAVDPGTRNGVVLLEDLINRGATFGVASQPLTPDVAAAVLSLQACYHAVTWNNPRLADFAWLRAGGALAEANMVDQFFGLWEGATRLPRFAHVPPALRDKSRVKTALNRLIQHLRANAVCLVHGDAHAANLFFDPGSKPGYLDWQHVMRGCWAFDVASFLITSLTVADRRASERALLTHYLGELAAHGAPAPTLDVAWRQYRRYAMWPFMWVMCPPDVHPEQVCTINTERACSAIEDLQSIEGMED